MKRYITSHESASMAVSTMAGSGKKFYAGRCDQDHTAIIGHTGKCFLQGFFNREIVTYHVLYGK